VLVSFKGNGYTGHEKVEVYLLRRCADVTIADGYDYFVIVDKNEEAAHSSIQTSGTYSSNTSATAFGTENMAFGQAHTTGTFYLSRPIDPFWEAPFRGDDKMFKGQKPGDDRAYDAHELERYLDEPKGGSN
jgi:hypothetical protein